MEVGGDGARAVRTWGSAADFFERRERGVAWGSFDFDPAGGSEVGVAVGLGIGRKGLRRFESLYGTLEKK